MGRSRYIPFVVLLALAGGAGAVATGSVVPSPGSPPARPAAVEPDPDSDSIEVRSSDPGGGPRWALRVYRSESGLTCNQFAREVEGRFGHEEGDGFRERRLDDGGSCGELAQDGALVALANYTDSPATPETEPARSIVHGVAGAQVAKVSIAGPGGTRELTPSGRGGFLTVYAGGVGLDELEITLVLEDGSRKAVG